MSVLMPSPSLGTTSTCGRPSVNVTRTNEDSESGQNGCGVMTEHIVDWTYYTQALTYLWPVKASVAAVATWLSTEPMLLWWLLAMIAADFVFGLAEAFKHNSLSYRMLRRGAMKIPVYCLYIFLVGALDACVAIAFRIDMPVLEAFIAYLVMQEFVSVTRHLTKLNCHVPPIMKRIAHKGKAKMERKIDKLLDEDGE